MPTTRTVEISHDASTWSKGMVPSEISLIPNNKYVNVDLALLHTAIWTRPPVLHGCHLHDVWAWLRYSQAIAATPDLRLREEWSDIDPHQKSVLSDELGVGFSTQLLIEELDYIMFADTLYAVNALLPGHFTLNKSTKVGPNKSPDYIGLHSSGKYGVLECKGSQTRRANLYKAMSAGIKQKNNLIPGRHVRLKHLLVVGLFMPQFMSNEIAEMRICDPDNSWLRRLLSEMSEEEVAVAVTQIVLAKQFAIMGYADVANWLALTPTRELSSRTNEFVSLITAVMPDEEGRSLQRSIEIPARVTESQEYNALSRSRIGIEFDGSKLLKLRTGSDLFESLQIAISDAIEIGFRSDTVANGGSITTPLGLMVKISD